MRLLSLLAIVGSGVAAEPEPRLRSIHPFTGQRGTTFEVTVRGSGLSGASGVVAPVELTAAVEQVKPDAVTLRVTPGADAKPGLYQIRLVTKSGVSNALPLRIVELPVAVEPDGEHNMKDTAVAVTAIPALFNGRLGKRGEADFYWFRARAGETFTFEVVSGFPQIAAAGSAATIPNFDPSLAIYEASGSWLDANRLRRVAFNDEPVWVFGKPTDARLVHRFEQEGEYWLRVEAFAGQGGPDYSYSLKIVPGVAPAASEPGSSDWDERNYTRRLDADRLNQLAARGGQAGKHAAIETYAGSAGAEPALFKLPGTIEGALAKPGEAHRARFRLDAPADIAIEIEAPAAAPPFFNPVVRLLDAATGEEVATNVFAGRGACTGALTKSLQAKTVVPLRNTGEYVVEVRDAAADLNSPEFRYRVQVRPREPHVGRVRIEADAVNLRTGEAKTVRVSFDREEDYRGAVSIAAEGLPAGVTASVGADYEPDTDPPMTAGKRERYIPRTERAVVVLAAAADAEATNSPRDIRLVVRPLTDGKLGEPLAAKTLPLMVVKP